MNVGDYWNRHLLMHVANV